MDAARVCVLAARGETVSYALTVEPSSESSTMPAQIMRECGRCLAGRVVECGGGVESLACGVGCSAVLPLCRSFYSLLLFLEDSSRDGADAARFTAADGTVRDVVPWAGRAVLVPHSAPSPRAQPRGRSCAAAPSTSAPQQSLSIN